jgi:predicted ATPase
MNETTMARASFLEASKALSLLSEIVEQGATSGAFPSEAALRARHPSEPWLIDDLVRFGHLRELNGILVPTVSGLRATDTPASRQIEQDAQRTFSSLTNHYKKNPRLTTLSTGQIGHFSGIQPHPLLAVLAAERVFHSVTMQAGVGSVQSVTLDGAILRRDPFEAPRAGPVVTEPAPITLLARDFQGLANVEWSPNGVCLVVGPNGSGKTTLLKVLVFLRDALQQNVIEAVRGQSGPSGLRRLEADGAPEIRLGARVGEVSWELRLPVESQSVNEYAGELVKAGEDVLLRRASYQPTWYLGTQQRQPDPDGRTCLRAAWDAQTLSAAEPLIRSLRSFRYYANYDLNALRNGGAGADTDRALDQTGKNLFVVLRNWKVAARQFQNRFEWVSRQARRAFPGVLEDIEFDPPVGQVVPARFFPPGGRSPLPMSRAADGLLVGLLHLTAVAGADDGATLAIDEMENQLHPHAIRALLEAMRERAEDHRLTVLLTTHSPVLMNAFRDHPEQLYVMEVGERALPIPLDKLRDPDWLAHFELGDLYERLDFGAPKATEPA